jgi:hypothetical protein
MDKESIIEKLNDLVVLKCKPFCYGCYIKAKSTDDGYRCPRCGSDDLMNLLEGYGCEYGTESFYEPILDLIGADKFVFDDSDDWFEGELTDFWGEVKICGVAFEAGWAFKQLDTTSFDCRKTDYLSDLESEETIVEIRGKYYDSDQLYELISDAVDEAERESSELIKA